MKNEGMVEIMTQSAAIWLPFDTSKVGPFAAGAHELLQVYITSPIAKLGSGTSMLTLNDGGTATLVGWGGNFMLFDYVVQPGQNTSNLLITGYSDNGAVFAGLSGTGFNDPIAMSTIFGVAPASPPLSVDTLAPTVASISRVGGATAGVGSVVQYSVTFSESVTGVDASAFSLKTTGVTGASIASVTGSGSSWVVSVNAGSGSGAIELDVTGGKIKDLAGNGLAAGVFQSPVNFPDSQFPSSIAVGDLNGDGKPDIVTGDGSSNTVSVLLGNGDGTFGVSQVFAAGSNTSSVSLADVNGDGKLDIVATNYGSSNISVLLGNGNGTFQTQKVYTTSNGPGLNPTFEAVVDVNHDGNFDVVTSDWGTNSVSVLLGNGDGTFKAPNVYAAGSGTFSIAVGDFNLDGNIDIVTANYNANSVSILLGNGNGTFQAQQTYAVGANP